MLGSTAWGYKYVGAGSTGETPGMTTNQPTLRSEACAPATGLRDLEWNNVKSLIETAGSLWQDRARNRAAYEVPIGGGVSSLYAGALWMGGISPDQQLKLAALTFRSGNDYWPGPLTADGSAEVDKTTCNEYDNFFVSTRADAQRHRQWHDSQAEGTSEEDFPDGYTMPAYFADYPAIGDDNQDYYLAPTAEVPVTNIARDKILLINSGYSIPDSLALKANSSSIAILGLGFASINQALPSLSILISILA